MADKELNIVVSAKNQASKALNSANKDIQKMTKSVKSSRAEFIKSAKSLAAYSAAIGAVAFASANKLADMASDAEESINAVNVVFKEGADVIKDFSDTAARSMGLSAMEFRQMSTETGTLLSKINQPMQETAEQTVILGKRAADLASIYNTDVSLAMSAINQALRGETEALRKYGGEVTETALQEYAHAQGIQQKVKDMNEAEKVELRMQKILFDTNTAEGDFQNTIDGAANSQRVLTAEIKDYGAELGKNVLPLKKQALEITLELMKLLKGEKSDIEELNAAWKVISIAIEAAIWVIQAAINTWYAIGKAIGHVIVYLVETMPQAWDFLKEKVMFTMEAIGFVIVEGWNKMKEKVMFVMEAIGFVIVEGWEKIKNTFKEFIEKISQQFDELIKTAKEWGGNLIDMFVQGIKDGIGKVKQAAEDVANAVSDFIGFHSPTKKGPASDSDKWAPNFIKMFSKGISDGKSQIEKASESLMEGMKSVFSDTSAIEAQIDKIKNLKSVYSDTISSIKGEIKSLQSEMASFGVGGDKRESFESSAAVEVLKQQEELSSLKNELSKESNAEERAEIERNINEIQSSLSDNAEFIKSIDSEIQYQKKLNEMDELSRMIFLFEQEKSLIEKQNTSKIAQLQKQMNRTNALYQEQKIVQIQALKDVFNETLSSRQGIEKINDESLQFIQELFGTSVDNIDNILGSAKESNELEGYIQKMNEVVKATERAASAMAGAGFSGNISYSASQSKVVPRSTPSFSDIWGPSVGGGSSQNITVNVQGSVQTERSLTQSISESLANGLFRQGTMA